MDTPAIAHVITHRNRALQAKLWRIFSAGLSAAEERAQIAVAEAEAQYHHGWFYDAATGTAHQDHGGRGIVWVDQPEMD